MENTIQIDAKFIHGMIKIYKEAVAKQADGFTYQGNEFVTTYAKYFLQFYAPKFNIKFDPK